MTFSQTMTYIKMTGPGAPDVMVPAIGDVPEPKADEVLIRVLAVGVNRPDISQRQGSYPPPPGASPVLGLEVAGEVVAHGPGAELAAKRWHVGDRVCALTNGGAYAQYCVAPATQCLPWPEGYNAIQAAALPENAFTVWANLFQAGRLQPGDSALVHGGSSGIGITAIQLGHAFGARIYATAGSAEKCTACERLGATAAINYLTDDFAVEIKRLTDGRGVDVILDMVGAPYAQRNLRCLAMDGRLVLIAFLGGPVAEKFDFTTIMTKRLVVTGSTIRPRTTAQKAAIARELLDQVWPLLNDGRCSPVIHEVFPLERVAEAHRLMESSAHIGKIMLEVAH
jgi:NADPH2:quinone reductase